MNLSRIICPGEARDIRRRILIAVRAVPDLPGDFKPEFFADGIIQTTRFMAYADFIDTPEFKWKHNNLCAKLSR